MINPVSLLAFTWYDLARKVVTQMKQNNIPTEMWIVKTDTMNCDREDWLEEVSCHWQNGAIP